MDPNVWRHLPTDLVRRVLSLADLPIDTRLHFKLENKKLNLKNFFKNFRNNLVYDRETKVLWDFRPMSDTDLQFFLKRKNLKFSCFRSPDVNVFNMGWDPYEFTMHAGSHEFGSNTLTNHLVIRDKIKFVN
jgi:hypothetical protein